MKTKPGSKKVAWDSVPSHPTSAAPDFHVDELPTLGLSAFNRRYRPHVSYALALNWRVLFAPDADRRRAEMLLSLAPRVRASLKPAERRALVANDHDTLADLDGRILYALGIVLAHSPTQSHQYLLVAARNLLRSHLRAARAKKRTPPDGAVLVSIDDPDAPVVVADIETPLDVLLAREDALAQRSRIPSKPLASANVRLRRHLRDARRR